MKCLQCGESFTPGVKHPNQKYCSRQCRARARFGKKNQRAEEQSSRKTLANWAREATECNLDYGNYRALIASGKTYEELKATADTRSAGEHAHKPYRYS